MTHPRHIHRKKRIDPLFVAVLVMLVLVPVLNACSSNAKPVMGRRTASIDTANVESTSLALPPNYEWSNQDKNAVGEMTAQSDPAESPFYDESSPPASRLEAIEREVMRLRRDFNDILPSIKRLVAIEQDMQELIAELSALNGLEAPEPETIPDPYARAETAPVVPDPTQADAIKRAQAMETPYKSDFDQIIAENTGNTSDITDDTSATTAPIPVTTPVVESTPPTPSISPPPVAPSTTNQLSTSTASMATVTSARTGVHPDVTRLVLDYKAGSTINYTTSPTGDQLVVTLSNTTWNGAKSWESDYTPLITSYTVIQNGADSVLTLSMEPDGMFKTAFDIPPNSDANHPRLVIDIGYGE